MFVKQPSGILDNWLLFLLDEVSLFLFGICDKVDNCILIISLIIVLLLACRTQPIVALMQIFHEPFNKFFSCYSFFFVLFCVRVCSAAACVRDESETIEIDWPMLIVMLINK